MTLSAASKKLALLPTRTPAFVEIMECLAVLKLLDGPQWIYRRAFLAWEGAWSRRLASALWEGPMRFGEEPRKQKTLRPERRGITRAVSPKKIGKRKKGMYKLRNVGEKGDPDR